MTEEREAELLLKVPTLRRPKEIKGFRGWLIENGEPPFSTLYAAPLERERAFTANSKGTHT
jgi:hypothetical protein